MRRLAWIATLSLSLFALPAGAAGELRPATDAGHRPIEIRVSVPPMEAAGLSMALPGAAQLYLGDPLKGGAYLGGSAALGIGAYMFLRQIVWPEDFIPPESNALIMLNAAGIAWLAGGGLSTLDAFFALQSQQPALEPSPVTSATPAKGAK